MIDPASPPGDRNFGEEGGRLSYGSYLRLPQLLSQQQPQSTADGSPAAHDELLFITIHQVYELWFKLLLHELSAARDAMLAGRDLWTPRHLLERASVVERILVEQVDVIETMTPQDFLVFRSLLAPASGFQSVQFRELEFLSGLKDAAYVDRMHDASAEELARLRQRLAEPTLWDGFLAVLEAHGLPVADPDERVGSLLRIARDRTTYGALWDLAEGLLGHDEMAGRWRARHVAMVERQIGGKSGTGGSTGAPYLQRRVTVRYYPELWDLRTRL